MLLFLPNNGDVFVGGTTGMTVINSAVHFDTDEDYTVELLDVLLNGLPVSLSEEPQEAAETIQIPGTFLPATESSAE